MTHMCAKFQIALRIYRKVIIKRKLKMLLVYQIDAYRLY